MINIKGNLRPANGWGFFISCKIMRIIRIILLAFICYTATATAQDKLKVVSFNIKAFEGDNYNVQPYVDHLFPEDADIICLNEVENRGPKQMTGNSNRDVVAEFATKLHMFNLFGYSYNLDNKQGKENESKYTYCLNNLYGNAILSRYPILNATSIQLPRPAGSADQRSVITADILLPSGKTIRVACTHLDHEGGRMEQVQVLTSSQVLSKELPTLLVGDLNAGPSSSELSTIEKSYMRLDDNAGTYYGMSKIDFILGSKDKWELITTKVMPRYCGTIELSDHCPVVSEILLK